MWPKLSFVEKGEEGMNGQGVGQGDGGEDGGQSARERGVVSCGSRHGVVSDARMVPELCFGLTGFPGFTGKTRGTVVPLRWESAGKPWDMACPMLVL